MSTYSIYIMQLYDSICNLLLVVWVLTVSYLFVAYMNHALLIASIPQAYGIFIGYAGYYLVRKNFALAMPYLVEMGFDKGLLGVAISANAIAYGLSKFLMGGVSDRSSARKFLPLGLTLSALTTLILGTRAGLSSVDVYPAVFNRLVSGYGLAS
jgi:sugar phosphate permease